MGHDRRHGTNEKNGPAAIFFWVSARRLVILGRMEATVFECLEAQEAAGAMTEGSITGWYNSLQGGNRAAAQHLWERFAKRLIHLARLRLRPDRRQGADEEDAVLSAFDSFCRAAEQGRFPNLEDREGLWQLLVAITLRKVCDQIAHEQRQKRGAGAVMRESDLVAGGSSLEEVMSREPTPEMAAEMTEQCQHLLDLLDDDELRAIALAKLEGYTDLEVAERLGCARSTVQRRLKLIRSLWESE